MIESSHIEGYLVHRATGVVFRNREDLIELLSDPEITEREASRYNYALDELETKLALESMSEDKNIWYE